MPGANAAPPPAAGSRAVAEQLELLFEEPLTAPGRAAAAPTEQPKNPANRAERADLGRPLRKTSLITALRRLLGSKVVSHPPRNPPGALGPPSRRGARWWGGRSATSRRGIPAVTRA